MHLTLLPFIDVTKEIKTKPTQHSVKELRSIGIQPDILLCRGKNEIDDRIKKKLALFTNVSKDAVFSAIDAETIYDIPVLLQKQNIDTYITKSLKLKNKKLNLKPWTDYRKNLIDVKGVQQLQ